MSGTAGNEVGIGEEIHAARDDASTESRIMLKQGVFVPAPFASSTASAASPPRMQEMKATISISLQPGAEEEAQAAPQEYDVDLKSVTISLMLLSYDHFATTTESSLTKMPSIESDEPQLLTEDDE